MTIDSAPRRPRNPTDLIFAGGVLAIIGAAIAGLGEAPGFGVLAGAIGGIAILAGAVGHGVLMALRVNRYEEDFLANFDDGDASE